MDKYQARKIRCKQCGALFVFSAEEQHRYNRNHFPDPERCKRCRDRNRQDLDGRYGGWTGCLFSNGYRHPSTAREQHYHRNMNSFHTFF